MKILLIGATGQTGRILLRKLPLLGHEVVAFARNPKDVAEIDSRIHVVKGDARDAASFGRAVAGVDSVISVFGPRSLKKDDIQESMMRNLEAAMRTAGVRRLINLSAAGVGDSLNEMPGILRYVFVPLFLGRMYADKERGERILFASSLEFVNVRPGRLLNHPARGGIKAQFTVKNLKLEMTREDLADFMIAQLQNSEWIRKSPFIGY